MWHLVSQIWSERWITHCPWMQLVAQCDLWHGCVVRLDFYRSQGKPRSMLLAMAANKYTQDRHTITNSAECKIRIIHLQQAEEELLHVSQFIYLEQECLLWFTGSSTTAHVLKQNPRDAMAEFLKAGLTFEWLTLHQPDFNFFYSAVYIYMFNPYLVFVSKSSGTDWVRLIWKFFLITSSLVDFQIRQHALPLYWQRSCMFWNTNCAMQPWLALWKTPVLLSILLLI